MFTQPDPIEPALKQLMNEIAKVLASAMNDATKDTGHRYGFALLMFGLEGDESTRMNYISNARREDMLAALKEFIARNEGTYDPGFDYKRRQ